MRGTASCTACRAREAHLPCRALVQGEVEELFDVVDVGHRGEVTQVELAAGLIDWKAFQVRSRRL